MVLLNKNGKKVRVPEEWKTIFNAESLQSKGYIPYDGEKAINNEAPEGSVLIERPLGGLGDVLCIGQAVRTKALDKTLNIKYTIPGIYAWLFRNDKDFQIIDYKVFCLNYIDNRRKYKYYYDMDCPAMTHKELMRFKPIKGRVQLFAEFLDVEPIRPTLVANELFKEKRLENNGKTSIGLVLRTTDKNRSWPMYKWPILARELKRLGYRPVTIDEKYCIDGFESISNCGAEKATALLDQLDLIVTADTGIVHIAGALGKPMVGIFGGTNGHLVTKYYSNTTIIQHIKSSTTTCFRPCYGSAFYNNYCCSKLKYAECLREIDVKEVLNAIVKKFKRS
jgi:hypothetical protein